MHCHLDTGLPRLFWNTGHLIWMNDSVSHSHIYPFFHIPCSVFVSMCVTRVVRSCKCRCFKPYVFCYSTMLRSFVFRTYRVPQKSVCFYLRCLLDALLCGILYSSYVVPSACEVVDDKMYGASPYVGHSLHIIYFLRSSRDSAVKVLDFHLVNLGLFCCHPYESLIDESGRASGQNCSYALEHLRLYSGHFRDVKLLRYYEFSHE